VVELLVAAEVEPLRTRTLIFNQRVLTQKALHSLESHQPSDACGPQADPPRRKTGPIAPPDAGLNTPHAAASATMSSTMPAAISISATRRRLIRRRWYWFHVSRVERTVVLIVAGSEAAATCLNALDGSAISGMTAGDSDGS